MTDLQIKKLKSKKKRYLIYDGDGLALVIQPSGMKSWRHDYYFQNQKRRTTLGQYPELSLAEARESLTERRNKLNKKIDPDPPAAGTVRDLAAEFMEKWSKPRKRTWREDERNIGRYILPHLGDRPINQVTRREVREMIEGIKKKGISGRPAPIHANNVFALIRKIFNFAIEVDLLDVSPCDHIRTPSPKVKRERMLSESELRALLKTLPELKRMTDGTRRALLLVLITAQRPGEIAAMDWSEIDGHWWTVPSARAKNKNPHRVWLTDYALETMPPRGAKKSGPVFPAPDGKDGPMGANVMARAMGRWRTATDDKGNPIWPKDIEPFTPHDLRRSAAGGMTGSGIPRLVVSKILNHADSGVTAIYDRHSYDNEKRQALERWSRHLIALKEGKQGKEGAEVIPFTPNR